MIDYKTLLKDSSKWTILDAASLVGNKTRLFREFLNLSIMQIPKYSARTARVLYACTERNPKLYKSFFLDILEPLPQIRDLSVLMKLVRYFTLIELPKVEELLGRLMSFCYDLIEAKFDKITLKVYGLEILYKITIIYPELKSELMLVIEKHLPYSQTAFHNRGMKIYKKLFRETGRANFASSNLLSFPDNS